MHRNSSCVKSGKTTVLNERELKAESEFFDIFGLKTRFHPINPYQIARLFVFDQCYFYAKNVFSSLFM